MSSRRKFARTQCFIGLTIMLLASMLLAACQSAAPASPTAAPKAAATTGAAPAAGGTVTVKVAFLPAYTGAVAAVSGPMAQGENDYFQALNEAGGFSYKDPKSGATMKAKIEFPFEDYAYDPARAVSIYDRLKTGAKAVISSGFSAGVGLAQPASRDKIPVLVNTAAVKSMLDPKPGYITTIGGLYHEGGYSLVTWIKNTWKESRAPRLGIFALDAASALAAIDGLGDFAKSKGWEVIPTETLKPGFTDATVEVKRLLGAKPDYIYMAVASDHMAILMRDSVRLGFKDAKWVATPWSFDPANYQKLADAETDGALVPLYMAMETETNLPGVKEAADAAKKYRNTALVSPYLQGWGTAKVLVEGGLKPALEKLGFDGLTPESVNTALHSLKDLDTGGIFQPATNNEAAPFVVSKARLVQWKDHKLSAVMDWQDGTVGRSR